MQRRHANREEPRSVSSSDRQVKVFHAISNEGEQSDDDSTPLQGEQYSYSGVTLTGAVHMQQHTVFTGIKTFNSSTV